MPPSFANTLQVNGFDLNALGFALNLPGGARDLAGGRDYAEVEAPDRDGLVMASTLPKVGARDLVLPGHVVADTHATLLSYLDQLKYRLSLGQLDVRLADDTTRRIFARLARFTKITGGKDLKDVYAEVEIRLRAHDPYWYDVTAQSLAFSSTATVMPQGTARTRPSLIRISGACTNPNVIYQDSAGVVLNTMALTYVQLAGDKIEINCQTRQITKTVSAVTTDASSILTSGDFVTLDPADGDFTASAWPKLRGTSSAGAPTWLCNYAKAWQ